MYFIVSIMFIIVRPLETERFYIYYITFGFALPFTYIPLYILFFFYFKF